MTLSEALEAAERLLPGVPAPSGEEDARWQAIIEVEEFIPNEPENVWPFILKWGSFKVDDPKADDDLRAAIGVNLIETLLEHHFDAFFARVKQAALNDQTFARSFLFSWAYVIPSDLPKQNKTIEALKARLLKQLGGDLRKLWSGP